MLIKFINNVQRSLLSKFDNFNGDQVVLFSELQRIVKGIDLEEYSVNFIIEQKIVNNFSIISKTKEMTTKFIDRFASLIS
jgi:hypothetical protein